MDNSTKEILEYFEQIAKIPRKSKQEEKICTWIMQWAKKHSLEAKKSDIGNICISKPATSGYENAPTIVLQAHLDMVCEKEPHLEHNFEKDPINLIYKDKWLTADKTTLGADNGIGIAMALYLLSRDDVDHPRLEVLLTVDEETGLTGAGALEPDFVNGRVLLNLDTEDEGVFVVGCAGGNETRMFVPLERPLTPVRYKAYKITVGGLRGGHSGVDIKETRGNAIRILAKALWNIQMKCEIHLGSIEGGSADNAIPRDANATVLFDPKHSAEVSKTLIGLKKTLQTAFGRDDPAVTISIKDVTFDDDCSFSFQETKKLLDYILALPHGVATMSKDVKGLVETSNNLATISSSQDGVSVLTSQRSSIMTELHKLTRRIEGIAKSYGGAVKSDNEYPSWHPNMDSKLLEKCKNIYKAVHGNEAIVEIIHAGLECGIIGNIYPDMDMISFGPTIKFPHSPDEKVEIESIGKVWSFLIALLQDFK